jgi:hypothetical protein
VRRSVPVVVLPDRTRVRLAPGRHESPREGVCVVELASLLAAEDFSDRPRCVCPVIAAYLRGWNDRAAHRERQRLAPYATLIVGSRGDRKTTRRRREICLEWSGARLGRGRLRGALARLGMRARIAIFCGIRTATRANEGAGDYAARIAMARRDAGAAFALLDQLLAVGGRPGLNGNGANGIGNGALDRHPGPAAARSRNGDNGHAPELDAGKAPELVGG